MREAIVDIQRISAQQHREAKVGIGGLEKQEKQEQNRGSQLKESVDGVRGESVGLVSGLTKGRWQGDELCVCVQQLEQENRSTGCGHGLFGSSPGKHSDRDACRRDEGELIEP
jgi:hypothetical protein